MRRGFTLAEIAVAAGLSIVLLALVGTGVVWMRNSMRLVTSLDQDSQVLWLSRLLNAELNQAREILFPPPPTGDKPTVAHQVAFVDSEGDVTVLFVEEAGRLIQFSQDRGKFRDLFLGVGDLIIRRLDRHTISYEVKRTDTPEPETISGVFQIQPVEAL